MKKKSAWILLSVLLAGCTSIEKTPFPDFNPTQEEVAIEQQTPFLEVTEEALKMFFRDYFSLTEDELLMLNQKPPSINSTYWESYTYYTQRLTELIGDYLSSDARKKLKEGYMTYDFHLPKMLLLNGYVTVDATIVEDVVILDQREAGERIMYQVAVTARHTVEPVYEAVKKYGWDREKAYYVKMREGENYEPAFTKDILSEYNPSYLFLQESEKGQKDQIKVVHYYWVQVKSGSKLAIESVKEDADMTLHQDTRQLATQTSHIERVPYYDKASSQEEAIVRKVMHKLMEQSRDFYTYFEKAYGTGYDTFERVWYRDLELEKEIDLQPDFYKQAFHTTINPYKHAVRVLESDKNNITLTPSVYSTQRQPRFVVSVPVKALLYDDEIVYYNYKYYICIEENKIESIQFMHIEDLDEAAYLKEDSKEETKDTDTP